MAGNILPILLLGGAAALVMKKKKKKKKTTAEPEAPEAPEEPPFLPDEEEPEVTPGEGAPPAEPSLETGTHEGPTPGKAVASGVERHYTGAYPWKILFTTEGDYAAHYYSMGNMGPHEEVARGETPEDAIEAFKFWATNEDRRRRNLPPLLIAKAVESTNAPQKAGISDIGD